MAEDGKWIRTEGKEIIVYLFVGLLLTIILPLVAGLILKGFSPEILEGKPFSINLTTYLGTYLYYLFLSVGALFVIIFPISRLIAGDRRDHPATRKNPNWFTIFTVSLIHSPEENGALYRLFDYLGFKGNRNPMRWSLSLFRVFIISILIFGGLGIFQVMYPQIAIAGIPATAQQLTTTSDVIFGAGVPSFSENGTLMFIFFILLGIDAYICSKFKLGLGVFFLIGLLVISPLLGLTWMGWHSVVYGNSSTKLLATFIFGWIGSSITLLTASFIFWLVWHFMNNMIIKLMSAITVKEDLLFIIILIWIALFVIYLTGEFLLYKYRKKKREAVIVPT